MEITGKVNADGMTNVKMSYAEWLEIGKQFKKAQFDNTAPQIDENEDFQDEFVIAIWNATVAGEEMEIECDYDSAESESSANNGIYMRSFDFNSEALIPMKKFQEECVYDSCKNLTSEKISSLIEKPLEGNFGFRESETGYRGVGKAKYTVKSIDESGIRLAINDFDIPDEEISNIVNALWQQVKDEASERKASDI